MKVFRLVFVVLAFLLVFPLSFSSSHYSFEHAEEMRVSGRIGWRDYGPDAFLEAVRENKPIFLLLTAPSWCYWCHVYTSDDYIYHPDVYPIINEKFIPIYVDADKRQDLTRKYLEGGWPSTTVMTPSRERLFGYSGSRPISFMISNLNGAYEYVQSSGFSNTISYDYKKTAPLIPTRGQINNQIDGYSSSIFGFYDPVYGGFGNGQKFPQGRALLYSLEGYEKTKDSKWLELVSNTLKSQYTNISEISSNYNLFDPIEGGFHRYGTKRDWTPPHYEKMLYDNAKLLRAYFHLNRISSSEISLEVVRKTRSYIEENWYDKEKGGFYGNTDVHGEDEYYGKNPRPLDKPRVEKTKYTDWNSEAILTYLDIYNTSGDLDAKEIARKSLDFFAQEMISDSGAYHYMNENGSKMGRGSLLDNSYLLLVFVRGHEALGEERYLDAAKILADYSLENLYDWNSGGFFERNSPDLEMYAPGENVDLTKPYEENGIISYALLRLYKITGEELYLNAGLKSIGAMIMKNGFLDDSYYYAKASEFILENSLLEEFSKIKQEIELVEKDRQKDFWVNRLIEKQNVDESNERFVLNEEGTDKKFSGSFFVLVLVSLFAGFMSFASPCTLPILPAFLAYGFRSSKKSLFLMSLFFFFGLGVVFSLLGMSASFIGGFLKSKIGIFSQIFGVFLIGTGLFIIFGRGFGGFRVKAGKPSSCLGSFLFGAMMGVSWTPCIGPILVSILLLASTTSSMVSGGALLFFYAAGLSIPLILLSLYIERVDKNGWVYRIIRGKEIRLVLSERREFRINSNTLFSGLLFIILGYLMFSGILFAFNRYVVWTSFQKFIFSLEERVLGFLK